MKKSLLVVTSLLVLGYALLAAALQSQNERVKQGDLVILNPTEGAFVGGPVFVDKATKTITSKASIFPIILRVCENGAVYTERHWVHAGAHIIAKVPPSDAELTLFRTHFPNS